VIERRTGTAVTQLAYDAAGLLVAARNADSEIQLERDVLGRVVSETVNGHTVATSYSERFGAVAARTRPSGAVTQWSYDESGRPSVLVAGGHHLRFAYDGGREVSRTWDAGMAIKPGSGRDQAPDDRTQPGDARYTPDALGRPVIRSDAAGDWHFTWDHEDRLVAVATPGGDHWQYRYDAFGRRIAKQRRGAKGAVREEIAFVWSGDLLVEQHHRGRGGKVTTTAWEYHPEMAYPVAQVTESGVQAVVTDEAGVPVDVVGIDGTRVGDLETIPLRSGGRYLDAETGLQYDRSRYYDPATARFLPQPRTEPAAVS
jgi:YD repeat-containing protein